MLKFWYCKIVVVALVDVLQLDWGWSGVSSLFVDKRACWHVAAFNENITVTSLTDTILYNFTF